MLRARPLTTSQREPCATSSVRRAVASWFIRPRPTHKRRSEPSIAESRARPAGTNRPKGAIEDSGVEALRDQRSADIQLPLEEIRSSILTTRAHGCDAGRPRPQCHRRPGPSMDPPRPCARPALTLIGESVEERKTVTMAVPRDTTSAGRIDSGSDHSRPFGDQMAHATPAGSRYRRARPKA